MVLQQNSKLSTRKKLTGIILIIASCLILLSMIVLPKSIGKIFIGTFGFSAILIFGLTLLIGIALIRNATYNYPVKYVVYSLIVTICVFCLLQLMFTGKLFGLPFAEYIKSMYGRFTPGGVVFGTLAYGIQSLIYQAGAYVFFIILGTVFVALLIDVKHAAKQFKRLSSRKQNKYINYEAKQKSFDEASDRNVKQSSDNNEKPILVALNNPNFKERPRPQPNQVSQQIVSEDTREQKVAKRAEDALTRLGLSNNNGRNKVQDELVRKQLQDYILTPSSIQTPPVIKQLDRQNNTQNINPIMSNESFKSAETNYNSAIRPEKRIYNNTTDTLKQNLNSSNNTINQPFRGAGNFASTPTIEPVNRETIMPNFNITNPIRNGEINNQFQHNNQNNSNIIKNSNVQSEEKKSIKAEVNDIESRINKILDSENFNEEKIEKTLTTNNIPVTNILNNTNDKIVTSNQSTSIYSNNIIENINDTKENESNSNIDIRELQDENILYNTQTPIKIQVDEPIPHSKLVSDFIKKFNPTPKPVQESFIDTTPPSKKAAPVFSNNTPTNYVRPPIELLRTLEKPSDEDSAEEFMLKAEMLEETLENFKIPAKVINITKGPAVTRFEIQMPPGKTVKLIQSFANDIAMALEANGNIRIEAPIPGRNAVGIEVPNKKITPIGIKEIITSQEFINSKGLTFALGKDIAGESMVCDITDMPHLLVAGSTGSGKSVCLNVLIVSLLYRFSPEDLRIILIDPKRVEFAGYAGLPHLIMPDPIIESKDAINALNWTKNEMDRRYDIFHETRVNNINEYNNREAIKSGKELKLPIILLIVDELSNLLSTNKREVEERIRRLAELARASGIHIVVATQRPSVDVITGTIKANLPSRIAFMVTSVADSRTILDQGGAENLLGKGDMLYSPRDYSEPKRIQCAYISNDEVRSVVEFIKQNNAAFFDENIAKEICKPEEEQEPQHQVALGEDDFKFANDPLFPKALKLTIETKQASVSMIQRRFSVGFARAARILDQMELANFVSPQDENRSKPRSVYITMDEFKEIFPDETTQQNS